MKNGIVWDNDVANVPNVPVGTEMFWIFPSEKVCDDLRIEFLSRTPAERLAESSPTLTGNWQTKNCGTTDGLWGPAGDPIPYEVSDTNPGTNPPVTGGGDAGSYPSTTQKAVANSASMRLVEQWQNGKCRLVDELATIGVSGSNKAWYFISGSIGYDGLPTTYDYLPGTNLYIQKVISPAANSWVFGNLSTPKGFAEITIGPAPN